jgi:hypothetical protein
MLLKEFFGNKLEVNKDHSTNSLSNDVFWFILDHDRIHKDYGLPIIKQLKKDKNLSDEDVVKVFLPLVNKGCKEYYVKNDMSGHLKQLFPKSLRAELCNQIYNHYCDNISD